MDDNGATYGNIQVIRFLQRSPSKAPCRACRAVRMMAQQGSTGMVGMVYEHLLLSTIIYYYIYLLLSTIISTRIINCYIYPLLSSYYINQYQPLGMKKMANNQPVLSTMWRKMV